ncbi:RHS repeat-associated core domain-containing protein [Streptomyces sp. Je 1-369]|uniref:RHS repeat-associated core domain-containing protein n=1 Tax=Streptomyces sp. Je 1-369 TaxID=2966192 RepID=UPI002285EFFB|nr:RHS repeat-associated core domain-containing protein [Streptomyces sp. Je 1-369]WAL94469.1 RHS repeat-associated core domain-containing protein [Streptomyces sp. Je 1-369]
MRRTALVRHVPGRTRAARERRLRRVAVIAGFSLLPGLLSTSAYGARPDPLGRPDLKTVAADDVSPFKAKTDKKTAARMAEAAQADRDAVRRAHADARRTVAWPKRGAATLKLPDAGTAEAAPGALPVTLAPPKQGKGMGKGKKHGRVADQVEVNVLSRQETAELGIKGVALKVTGPATGGKAELGIQYAKFATAYGGDWAGRLQVARVSDCALRSPEAAKCHKAEPLPSVNERGDQRLAAQLDFPATAPAAKGAATSARSGTGRTLLLAVSAGTQSGGGDFKATPLTASSTWEAGGSAGTFTWSYPLKPPAPAAGPKPTLDISYNSSSVDGRTATTNNQGTQVGEGFDLTESFVERKYGSCNDDGQDKKYDLCWKYDNASLVLNGKATELVKDDTDGKWRLKNDDASVVTHSTGAENGDDNGEHWTVVTGDGTKYVFGLNKLDGAAAADRTESTWTVPVFGDDSGEPGYEDGTTFSGRDKKQAWRWNLDYVEDTHGNAMSYWYEAEHNNYDKLGDDNTGTDYVRGGYLKEIRYGQRAGALFSATPAASDKVVFTHAERCVASGSGCDSLTKDTRDNWPDVPFDSLCKDGDKCTYNLSPTFFSRKRLTGVTTSAWDAGAATPGYAPVDSWSLKQRYLDPGDTGDSTDQSLWLDEIEHTGKRGADLSLDPVKFDHVYRPNRVDGPSDDILPFNRPRLKTITSETGAQTIVDYLAADCAAGQTMPKADENTKRCYPVYWSPNGELTPILDWFQKYPVSGVQTTDPRGGSEAVQHIYTYSGGGAWHYNDDPMTPAKERTWSIWRGYEKVTHLTGSPGGTQSKEVSVFLRGMNGDRVLGTDGKTPDADKRKSADVTGVKAPKITDSDQYAGFTRETVSYDGATEVSGTVNDPWSKRTGTQHKSYADTEAYFVRTAASHARTNVTSKLTPVDRVRTTKTTYDDYGMPETVEDTGDDAVKGDEKCTRTWYARNSEAGINSATSRTRSVAKPCSVTDAELDLPADSTRSGDVISDEATAYDTTTWSAAQKPTKGEAQWKGRAKGYGSDNAPVWQQSGTVKYDVLGRPTVERDTHDDTVTSTGYTPATTGPLTGTTVTNAKGFKTTTAKDFGLGVDLKVTDPNGKATESEYDSLGRILKVWLPNRSKSLGKTPNYVYGYSITAAALPWVSSGTLQADGSGYTTTYEIFDSQLRTRQVQAPSASGGRVIAETLYDDRGLAVTAESDIWDAKNAPSGVLAQIDGGQAPTQTDTVFDGAARAIKTTTKNRGVARWSTETVYQGDTVITGAPAGGQAAAVVTDALGQTTERREYSGPKATGTEYTTTTFGYTPRGLQKSVTGPGKDAAWTYTYDLFGRQVHADDPDKGGNSTEYNDLDQPVRTTDNTGKSLLVGYDELNRKTAVWQNSKTDANKLAAWTFDSLAKGQQDTAVRYDGGLSGKAYIQKVTSYDSLYKVTGKQIILPDGDPLVTAGVPKTLSFSTGYNLDGTVKQSTAPAVAGLAAETVSYGYDALGRIRTAKGATGYLQDAAYSPVGDKSQLTLGTDATAKKAYVTNEYEDGTRRLTRSYVTDDVHGYMLQDLKYHQDDAGNMTSVFDATTLGGTGQADYQCFDYDGQRRLTEAWTPKTADCATTGRTVGNLGGAAPYWTSYQYDDAGLRTQQTDHASAGNTVTDYRYGTETGQPHALARTESGGKTKSYSYYADGTTRTRPGTQAEQTLTWNAEGSLQSVSEPAAGDKGAKKTEYLYDAGGDLLIRRATSGDGETVMYLGAIEVRVKSASGGKASLSGTRYYTAGDQTVAVRTATAGTSGSKLAFLVGDHHGTSSLVIDATTMAFTKRQTTPFGAPRGAKPAEWPDDKGFLGKPTDQETGLTHVGAREYDPVIGRFLSVDPVIDPEKAQSLNGYTYGNNNPATFSDPTGLDIGGLFGMVIGGLAAVGSFVQNVMGMLGGGGGGGGGFGGTGYTGGTAPTNNWGWAGSINNGWKPGATYNLITKSWDYPFLVRGGKALDEVLASVPEWGIVQDPKAQNGWTSSRQLFFGWVWGGGWPLKSNQYFHGGDAFTAILARDGTIAKKRAELLGQAREKGMEAKGADEKGERFSYKDVGPDPGSSFWKFNSLRGAASDIAGTLTNGAIGTSNSADAFLGSYSGTARIKAVDKRKGTVTLRFTATNLSDWNSATHVLPRSWNPVYKGGRGALVTEQFGWEEKWPLGGCVSYSEWLE